MIQRNEQGHFVKGCQGGPGRPPRELEASRLKTLAAVVSDEDWRAVCEQAVRDAKDGDAAARAWLSKYLLPSPVQIERERVEKERLIRAILNQPDAEARVREAMRQYEEEMACEHEAN